MESEHPSSAPAGQAGRGQDRDEVSDDQAGRGRDSEAPREQPGRGQDCDGVLSDEVGRGQTGDEVPGDLASASARLPYAPGDLAPTRACPPYAPSDLASLEQKIREIAKPRPLYTPASVRVTHVLHYDWTGWTSENQPFPLCTAEAIRAAAPLWKSDGIVLKEWRVRTDSVQILCAAAPEISPVLFTARAKGRLQHALRQAGTPVKFSRKVAFRSLGENIRDAVEGYLGKQVRKEGFVDPRFVKKMEAYTVVREEADLSTPVATHSGQYWYNLHLVLVVAGRRRIVDYPRLAAIRDAGLRIAKAKGFLLKSLSVMPDHLHVALRGDVVQSPEEMALSFMNNSAFLLGRNRIWGDECYVGTFSEYDLATVQRLAR
jgi:REP element-mobilizing transposase RayT